MSRVAQVLIVVSSAGGALWLAAGDYPIGLDFLGGANVGLESTEGADARDLLEPARRLLERADLEGSAIASVDRVRLELPDASQEDVDKISGLLTATKFRLLEPCDSDSWTWSPGPGVIRTTLGQTTALESTSAAAIDRAVESIKPPTGAEILRQTDGDRELAHCLLSEAIASSNDIVDARVDFSQVRPQVIVELSEAAGERFHTHSIENVDRILAIVLDGRVVSAPVIREPIAGGTVAIDFASAKLAEANELAGRLRSSSFGMRVVDTYVVEPGWPPTLGAPISIAFGLFGALVWIVIALRRRAHAVLAVAATFASAFAIAEGYVTWRGLTLTTATHLASMLLAVAAAGFVVGATRSSSSNAVRLRASWPGLVGGGLLLLLTLALASSVGFWRGAAISLTFGFTPAMVVGVVATMALPAATGECQTRSRRRSAID